MTCSGQPGVSPPSSEAVWIVTSNQDQSPATEGSGSDTPSSSSHALSLSLPVVLPPTSWVALGKLLSLSEPRFPRL